MGASLNHAVRDPGDLPTCVAKWRLGPLTPFELGQIVGAGVLAGAMNAVLGGGSFVTLPALMHVGVAAVVANATSSFALTPGTAASAWAYRRELPPWRTPLAALGAASVVGGGLGAWLLLVTPEALFLALVPPLLLGATLLLTFAPRLRRKDAVHDRPALAAALQLGISVYGGYYGGGMGILMLAAMTLTTSLGPHEQNALRCLLAVLINGVALTVFILGGRIGWPSAGALTLGAILGGYFGARYARRLPARLLRRIVLVLAWLITAVFWLRLLH